MPSQDWKTLMGFTERFAVIDQIASALALPRAEALKSAQAIENSCFNGADSLSSYTHLWRSHLPMHPPPSPIFSPPTPTPCTPGAPLGRYPSCHYHTSGLFSTLYRAPYPPHLPASQAQYVALKLTTPSRCTPPHSPHREARILAKLAPHDHIIELLETFADPPGTFTLVFPFHAHTLATLLSASQRPSEDVLLRILRETAEALRHVHENGILHRDVKPSNILISASQHAYLADFGIAFDSAEPGEEEEGGRMGGKITDVGTTAYRAPEILFGWRGYGTGLDMWAFGCVVAECFMDSGPGEEGEEEGQGTFFDAGELGSELRLVGSIFQKLGTPGVERWPEAQRFPDFGKMLFHQFPQKSWAEMLPGARKEVRELVAGLLVYESADRLSAKQVVEHEVFKT